MLRSSPLLAAALIIVWTCASRGGTPMTTQCQKNLDDGRILVVDGRVLPDNARFKVRRYTPVRREDGWSYGTCVLDVTATGRD